MCGYCACTLKFIYETVWLRRMIVIEYCAFSYNIACSVSANIHRKKLSFNSILWINRIVSECAVFVNKTKIYKEQTARRDIADTDKANKILKLCGHSKRTQISIHLTILLYFIGFLPLFHCWLGYLYAIFALYRYGQKPSTQVPLTVASPPYTTRSENRRPKIKCGQCCPEFYARHMMILCAWNENMHICYRRCAAWPIRKNSLNIFVWSD